MPESLRHNAQTFFWIRGERRHVLIGGLTNRSVYTPLCDMNRIFGWTEAWLARHRLILLIRGLDAERHFLNQK